MRAISLGAVMAVLAAPCAGQVIGTSNAGSNAIPFHNTLRYQQIFDAAVWSGAVSILELGFRNTLQPDYGLDFTADFYLSTSSASLTGLSPDLDSNLGSNTSLFGSFSRAGAFSSISFAGSPFVYDPSEGNLLLDIRFSSNSGFAFFDATLDSRTSRGWVGVDDGYGNGVSYGYGLVTEFSSRAVSVPEPAPYLLLSLGLLALAYLKRRQSLTG